MATILEYLGGNRRQLRRLTREADALVREHEGRKQLTVKEEQGITEEYARVLGVTL